MSYRDTFDSCPRCGVVLVDAGSCRACPSCGGLWIEESVVSDMVFEMLPPQPLSRLELAVLERGGEAIACPTCKRAMHATTIHGVALERCPEHGVWFDAGELETALHRVADPSRPPPIVRLAPARKPPPSSKPTELGFAIQTSDQPSRRLVLNVPIVKIGRVATSDLRLADERVNRMHAIIDATAPDNVWLIDLGSSQGTFVNGRRITKAKLNSGDQIVLGGSTVVVTIGPVR